MPCRTRRLGLEPEALGIVFLEASACGLPLLVGDSGGASETVIVEETGYVVDPREADEIATWVSKLLKDPVRLEDLGRRGREWVEGQWTWDEASRTLRDLLNCQVKAT